MKKNKTENNFNPLVEKYQKEIRWVNYRIQKVKGQNRTTKVPYSPVTKNKAASTDQSHWGTFAQALAEDPAHVGIIFSEDKLLLGIDIDHCLTLGTSTIEHEQKENIARLIIEADTYTEISPSGTGLHLYLALSAPLSLDANRSGSFEAYTSGRYFTVTQNPYKEVSPVREVTPEEAIELLGIIGYPWGKTKQIESSLTSGAHVQPTSIITDTENILDKMFSSKNGSAIKEIYEGSSTPTIYKGDESSADMALLSHLAFWCAKDPLQMESLWLASPLGQREKTQKRKDYRDRSISAAIQSCKEVYEDKKGNFIKKIQKDAPALDLLYTIKDKERVYTQNLENMCRILRHHVLFAGMLRYDSFKNTLEIGGVLANPENPTRWRLLEDYDTLNIQTAVSIIFSFFGKVSKDMINDAILKVSRENTTDTAIDYIKSLVWDGTPRLDTWIHKTYNTPDDIYHSKVGSNWLKGLIKRLCVPGCKFDHVLVLEGEQGIKKSTSLAILGDVYPDAPNWHVETTMSTENKDFFMQFSGKAIVEFSEGETLSRTEVKRMKAIITTPSDKYRPAYGRLSVDFPRRCVFAMTTNQTEYLKDETGNRRWLPVACIGQVNIEWLKENRDQLFAEAYQRVMIDKESTWEFPEEETLAMQSARRVHSPNQDLIAHWYFNKLLEHDRNNGITAYQVFRDALYGGMPYKSMSRYEEMEIADVMRNYLKLEKTQKMIDGVRSMRWFMTRESENLRQEIDGLPPTELESLAKELKKPNLPF